MATQLTPDPSCLVHGAWRHRDQVPSPAGPSRTSPRVGDPPSPAPRVLSRDPSAAPGALPGPGCPPGRRRPAPDRPRTVERLAWQVARPVPVLDVGRRVVEGEVADEGAGQRHLLGDPQVHRQVPEGAQLRPQHEDPVDDEHCRAGTRDTVPEGDQAPLDQPRQVGAVPVEALGRQLAASVALLRRAGKSSTETRCTAPRRAAARASASMVLPAASGPSIPTSTRGRPRPGPRPELAKGGEDGSSVRWWAPRRRGRRPARRSRRPASRRWTATGPARRPRR